LSSARLASPLVVPSSPTLPPASCRSLCCFMGPRLDQ
jgi:hypothetical protein